LGRARAAAFVASSFAELKADFDLRKLFPNAPEEHEQTADDLISVLESWPSQLPT
jgi:hypothetical protein